ncbi:MAG: DUF1552 domain-containing protein [Pedosphaera sp.]|nr:DUF1552 domain-containing protein [Pedosphaera sp.]
MKHTSRRAFLQGLGGTVLALPWLESLGLAVEQKPAQRAVFYYVPIGVVRRSFFPGEGDQITPKFGGNKQSAFKTANLKVGTHPLQLTPTLQPLAKVKDKVTLITGLDRDFQPGTDVHAQCASCFLTSAAPFSVKRSPYPQARTLDHVLAEKLSQHTPFRTLEFSSNSHKDNKESIQFDNISWYGTEHVAPSMRDPRKAYRRLFGTHELQAFRNITDLVLEDARSLKRSLGYADQQKFNEYFESIRTIEVQVDRLEQMKTELQNVRLDEPADAHLPRGEYIRLMGDLMVVALQTGLTNVASFMVGPERWDTPYLYESLFDKPLSHHQMSHNQGKFIKDLEKVDHFHMQQFAYLLEKMNAIEEANGTSLLDNTIFTYGSGLGDGATHQYSALPIIVAGSAGGRLKTGAHINLSETTGPVAKVNGKYVNPKQGLPLANLWLTQMQAFGLKQDRFADSSGVLKSMLA